MTIRESDVSQSPSHQSLEVSHPRFQTWIPHFPYRHPERSREIFLALRSLSHWHWQGNDALVLRISAFSHPSFIGLQRRFLASLEMTIRESDVSQSPNHQSLIPAFKPVAAASLQNRKGDARRSLKCCLRASPHLYIAALLYFYAPHHTPEPRTLNNSQTLRYSVCRSYSSPRKTPCRGRCGYRRSHRRYLLRQHGHSSG